MASMASIGVLRVPSTSASSNSSIPNRGMAVKRLSFSSSCLSGDRIRSQAGIGGRHAVNERRPMVVSPKAVSDSRNSQTCLDPEASRSVLGIILGGGAGTRLYPLTKKRAKPAVPLGANYRLIDIPVSNCLNSNVSKIYVLTQFNSASLNRHLSRAYASNMGGYKNEGFVEVLAAQQSPENPNWFQGTADAVRQYLWLFEEHNVLEFLILAGDHLYRMDYERFIQAHRETDADITVAALPMDEKRATAFGLMKIDEEGRIIEFAEKPKGEQLKAMKVDTTILGLDDKRAKEMPYIASMGIYVISKDVMLNLLREQFPGANDFGSEVIPGATSVGMRVQAYLYDGYWEDIGTIEAFYNANLGITKKPIPDFSFYFKRASTAADEAMKGYYSHFRDYYGFTSDVPITFDWASAKAIEGSTKFNSNDEELPKAITICNYIAGSPNYVPPMFYKLGQLAKDHEELVWGAMRKHWNSAVVHFDDKGATPGKCDWALNSVKDGVIDLTMKWNFSQYMGDGNYDAAGELAFTWLDDAENIKMQVMKANTTKPGAWTNFNTHTVDYLKEKLGDAAPPVVINWDEIAATAGRFLDASNYPPERASWILTKLIGEGQLLYAVHWALDHVLKDNDGKEAFQETFKEIKINVSAGSAHSLSAAKSGSSLVFTITVDMKDHYNAERNHDYSAVGKAIEAML